MDSKDVVGAEFEYLSKEELSAAEISCTKTGAVDIRETYFALIPEVRRRMVADGLADLVDIMDFSAISAIGFSKFSNSKLISVLLIDTIDSDVRLVGEGGIEVILDPCARIVMSTRLFRL